MEKTLIRQNAQWSGKAFEGLFRRDIMNNLLKNKTMRHLQILTGVRRCGKSTIFKLLINDLLQSGVSSQSILVLNLDDPQFIPFWDDSSKLFGAIANVFRYSPQSGSALENLAYNELKNKGYENISFDNSKTECDFIAYKNGKASGFQICYELNDMNLKRELNGFDLEKQGT